LRKLSLDVSATEARLFINDAFRLFAYDLSSNRGRKLLCDLRRVKQVSAIFDNSSRPSQKRRQSGFSDTYGEAVHIEQIKNTKVATPSYSSSDRRDQWNRIGTIRIAASINPIVTMGR
jgi:hypothetical protein